MIQRHLATILNQSLAEQAAVVLLGPRQAGKTTLAMQLAEGRPSLYLDLESEADSAMLTEPVLFLRQHLDRLVILDEVHRAPGLFPALRGLIDQARREGRGSGRFLLLGSASLDLLRQSGESLAGRVAYHELTPFMAVETSSPMDEHWLRGGFPPSLLAADNAQSLRWRRNFIRSYLERDLPQFGPRIPAESLRRLWTMLAHQQGGLLNTASLSRSLGLHVRTVGAYLDLLCDLLLVRRLPPWHANVGKRLVKSPKFFVRDSGLVHALLGLENLEALLSHPVAGPSWEAFVVEQLLALVEPEAQAFHYRTSGGAEVDLYITWPDGESWQIEIKRSLSPRPSRGFHSARQDLQPTRALIIHPGDQSFPLGNEIEALSLGAVLADLKQRSHS